MEKSDVIVYQIMAALIAAAAVFCVAKFGGHWMHEREAHTIEIGDKRPGEDGLHDAAKLLANGYKDTPSFDRMRSHLTEAEIGAGDVTPFVTEKYAIYAALAALVIGFFASHEAARTHARKKAAKASVNRATQKWGKPGA